MHNFDERYEQCGMGSVVNKKEQEDDLDSFHGMGVYRGHERQAGYRKLIVSL